MASVGGDCVDFQDNSDGTGTNDTSGDTANGASDNQPSSQQNGDQGSSTDQQTQQDQNANNQNTDNQNADNQQSSQDDNTDQLSQSSDNNSDDSSASDTSGDNSDNNSDTSDGSDNGSGNECVVASSVPNEPLLPTGVSSKSGGDEKTAEKKSGGDEKTEARGGEQKKATPDNDKKPENNGDKQKADASKESGSGGGKQKSGSGGKKLEIQTHSGKKVRIADRSGTGPIQDGTQSSPKPALATDLAPQLAATQWASPSSPEVASTDKPRRFTPSPGTKMTFSARALGLYDVPVASSDRLTDLDNGLVRVPQTSLPWDKKAQKNVYIAGHYLGLQGTQSRLVFYRLNELKKGDELVLKDDQGRPYKYRVSEKFAAGPNDRWAMGEVRGRDMVTLRTCIPPISPSDSSCAPTGFGSERRRDATPETGARWLPSGNGARWVRIF